MPAAKSGTVARRAQITAAGGTLYDYDAARRSGATHTGCLGVLAAGGTLGVYNWMIIRGITHVEAVALARAGSLRSRDFTATLSAYRLFNDCERATPALVETLLGLGASGLADPAELAHAARVCTDGALQKSL